MRTKLRRTAEGAAFALLGLDDEERRAAEGLRFVADGDLLVRAVDPAAPDLDVIYAQFARAAPTMLAQAARREPTPWEDGLALVVERAGDLDWWLTGSAALALRAVDVAPRDLDLVASAADARALAERLADILVEPLGSSDDWVAQHFGRAFGPARIEWVGGVRESVDEPEPTDLGPYAAARLEAATWRGHTIRVPPLGLQLATARQRRLVHRVAAIELALRAV